MQENNFLLKIIRQSDRYKKGFFDRMNKDIENERIINWQQFKRFKRRRGNKLDLDSLDMTNIKDFFRKPMS